MYERHIEANDNVPPQEMSTILSALYAAWCSETCRLRKKKRTLFGLSTLSISNSDIYKSLTISLGHIISSIVDEPYSERTDLNYAIHLAALIANLDKVLRMLQIYWKKFMFPRKNTERILRYSKTDCSSQLQGSLCVLGLLGSTLHNNRFADRCPHGRYMFICWWKTSSRYELGAISLSRRNPSDTCGSFDNRWPMRNEWKRDHQRIGRRTNLYMCRSYRPVISSIQSLCTIGKPSILHVNAW